MNSPSAAHPSWLDRLNPAQRHAVTHAGGPLLVVAGAGTGKTQTLTGRVAHLVERGTPPDRILLLTFTRRAASEMLARASELLRESGRDARGVWGGTFHAVAMRLLRTYAGALGLDHPFAVLDPTDAADLLNVLRHRLGLGQTRSRFPQKATCLAIYSRCVNADRPLAEILQEVFPWCAEWVEELRRLFVAYTEEKQRRHLLDFDDLLLYWRELARDPTLGPILEQRFDHILVDEYQDTNGLQVDILRAMRSTRRDLTVVGDEAQCIYAFRGAVAGHMTRFTELFPDATVVVLEENYRSVQPILDSANALLNERPPGQGFPRALRAVRGPGETPVLLICSDEDAEARAVAERILRHYEEGVPLHRMAVLMRAADHSTLLEVELARRNIPFRKYGGLRFMEIAHVKDLVALLRWMVHPQDELAAVRVLQLLPGIGPATAAQLWSVIVDTDAEVSTLLRVRVPAAARPGLEDLLRVLRSVRTESSPPDLVERAIAWYTPWCAQLYENPESRQRSLKDLVHIAAGYESLEDFLADLALDPPSGAGDLAGPPLRDDDWLVLSTIHSAKGGEWDVVLVLHAADGFLPADMACGSTEELEEERRLLYVALTRARDYLYVTWPQRCFVHGPLRSDRHILTPLSRFITPRVRAAFRTEVVGRRSEPSPELPKVPPTPIADLHERLRARWQTEQR